MAHFFLPQTKEKTDFFVLKACQTVKAGLWNVGGPPLLVSSDDAGIANVSSGKQYGGSLAAGSGMFEFFITGVRAGNILIRAKNDAGNQWAFTQAVVSGADLCLNAVGSDVQQLQERLNARSPTRLPRLKIGRFDVLTKARVMEFQWQQGLKADGVAGPKTLGRLASSGSTSATGGGAAPSGRCVLVDLIHTTLFAYDGGVAVLTASPVHGGSPDHPSHAGVFPMSSRRLREHTSSSYPIPPGNMNFSLFYNGPEALHQGPGSIESKGCIHVNPPYAEQLFNWAGAFDVLVIVVK